MATIDHMRNKVRVFERMTLAQVKAFIQNSDVDTNAATAQAAQIEAMFLPDASREVRIAVFLSGLMANLVGE